MPRQVPTGPHCLETGDAGLLGAPCEPDGGPEQCACGLTCLAWGSVGLCSVAGCDAGSACGLAGEGECLAAAAGTWCTPRCDPSQTDSCARSGFSCAPDDLDGGFCDLICSQQAADFCALQYGYGARCFGDGCVFVACPAASLPCGEGQVCLGKTEGPGPQAVCVSDCRDAGNDCPPDYFCDSAVGLCSRDTAASGKLGDYCEPGGSPSCNAGLTCVEWGGAGICTVTGCANASVCGAGDAGDNPCIIEPDGGSFCTAACPTADVLCTRRDMACAPVGNDPDAGLGCQPDCVEHVSGDCVTQNTCFIEAAQFCDGLSGYGSSCRDVACASVPCEADGGCPGGVCYAPPDATPSCVPDCRTLAGICPADRTCDPTTGVCR